MSSNSSAMSRRLRQFAESTDTHGFKFLAGSGVCGRLFWLLLITSSISFLAYFFYDRVDYFYQYKSTTNVEYGIDKDVMPRLPPIALCNWLKYMINASKLTVSDIVNSPGMGYGSLGLVRENIVELSADGDIHLKRTAVDFFGRLLLNKSLIYSDEAEQFWVRDKNFWSLQLMRESVKPEDTSKPSYLMNWRPIVKTLAAGSNLAINERKDYDVEDVVERCVFTPEELKISTQCFIETDDDRKSMSCPRPSDLSMLEGQRCFLVHSPNNSMINSLRVRVNNNVVIERSVVRPDTEFSWSMFIHYGSPKQKKVVVKNKQSVTVKVTKTVSSRLLGAPYSAPCGQLSHMTGNRYSKVGEYSAAHCIKDCKARCKEDVMAERYHCREIVPVFNKERQLDVCFNISHETYFTIMAACDRICLSSGQCPRSACEQTLFFTDQEFYEYRFTSENRVQANLFAPSGVESTVYTEVALYPAAALLAELGGTMRLFLGVSVLTVAHCLEFWLREALAGVRHCCRTTASRGSLRSVVHSD